MATQGQLKLKNISQKGNSIFIQSYPLVGVMTLVGFSDVIVGEDSQNFFKKFFRFSVDGIEYSEWKELNFSNFQNLNLNSKKIVLFEFRYDKTQPIGEDKLKLEELNVSYQKDIDLNDSEIFFKNSVFSSFFKSNDIRVLDWYINVLSKLYQKGIVVDFISRGKNKREKEDYLQFWGSIAKFFAYYVTLSKHFENFQKDENLLLEFLKQRSIKITQQLDFRTLNFLTKDFLINFTRRGTNHVFKKQKGEREYDGELLRLIGYNENDEFLFSCRRSQEIGWNLQNSSPLYRGMSKIRNANKFYEQDGFENQEIDVVEEYRTEWFVIDSKLDYHLFLQIQGSENFYVGVEVLDEDGNFIKCISYKTGEESNVFINNGRLYRDDKILPISLYLYNTRKKIFKQDTTTIRQGNDLILNSKAKKIRFVVRSGGLKILDRVFSILKTPYSHGLIQVKNIIDAVIVNNNFDMSFKEIHLFIERYLIPYNQHLLSIDPSDERLFEDVEEENEISSVKWIEGEGYCERLEWRGKDLVCEVINVRWIGDEETKYCQKFVSENGVVKKNGKVCYLWLIEIREDGTPTGRTKPNLPEDPDYIAPYENLTVCPITPTTTTTTSTTTTTTRRPDFSNIRMIIEWSGEGKGVGIIDVVGVITDSERIIASINDPNRYLKVDEFEWQRSDNNFQWSLVERSITPPSDITVRFVEGSNQFRLKATRIDGVNVYSNVLKYSVPFIAILPIQHINLDMFIEEDRSCNNQGASCDVFGWGRREFTVRELLRTVSAGFIRFKTFGDNENVSIIKNPTGKLNLDESYSIDLPIVCLYNQSFPERSGEMLDWSNTFVIEYSENGTEWIKKYEVSIHRIFNL